MRHAIIARAFTAILVIAVGTAQAAAQAGEKSLGTARVTKSVLANGQPLAIGTYTLRVTSEIPKNAVGQNPDESRWIEFVQDGQVKGREMATVLSGEGAQTVLKGQRPARGTSKTEPLRGNVYIRIWVNRGEVQYLIHLPVR